MLPVWVLTATYMDVRYAWLAGRLSDDQWQAYLAVWYYSAPRFSNLVYHLPRVRDVNAQLDKGETS